jgi:hypothetical protein
MDVPGGVWRTIHEEEWLAFTPVLPDGLVGIVGAPVLLHRTLDLLCIEVRGDLSNKKPLFYRNGMPFYLFTCWCPCTK